MTPAISRSLMTLAACCLGESRREWALAMQAEFEAAIEDRKRLLFSAGCLVAALREMPRHAPGRLALATHMLALGLLVPVAYLQFAYAIGLFMGQGGDYGMLAVVASQDPILASAQLGGMPALLVLWVLLGIGHLHLAWMLMDGDWLRVGKGGALIAAATLTLVIFIKILQLDATPLIFHAAALAIESAFILAIAEWHARLFPDPSWAFRER